MSALGLGGYSSSEGEEDVAPSTAPRQVGFATDVHSMAVSLRPGLQKPALDEGTRSRPPPDDASAAPAVQDQKPTGANEKQEKDEVPSGPAAGPAPQPAESTATPLPELEEDTSSSSPYTHTRNQMRNLTMPPEPDFDIPPSPPGSPSAISANKATQFLALKKKATHFNERVLQSSALRNPELAQKLTGFAQISQEDQYKSSLPQKTAVRTQYPESAYADQLIKAHKKIAAEKENDQKGKRTRLDFVAGKSEGGDATSPPVKKSRTHG
ncbi:hypothetical protein MBLNU457_1955t1 [Dothideomycetes sp. NU457]